MKPLEWTAIDGGLSVESTISVLIILSGAMIIFFAIRKYVWNRLLKIKEFLLKKKP